MLNMKENLNISSNFYLLDSEVFASKLKCEVFHMNDKVRVEGNVMTNHLDII